MRPTLRRPAPLIGLLVAALAASVTLTACGATPTVHADHPGAVVWTFDAGSEVWSSPAIDGGRVFVGSDSGELHALDVATGKELWSAHTGGAVRARPTVAHGVVYVTSDDGSLYAVREKNGDKVWTTDVGTQRPSRDEWTYQGSSPTVADGLVIVGGSDGTVRAVDAGSGSVRWTFATQGPIRTAPAVADHVVYVGSDDRNLYALASATGKKKWVAGAPGPITSSPTVAGDAVYVGSRGAEFEAYGTADGKRRWQSGWGGSWVESTASVVQGTAFVGSSDIHELRAIRTSDGAVVWRTKLGGWPWSSPAVVKGVVYQGSLDRPGTDKEADAFHAVDAKTGKVLWSLKTGDSLAYKPEGDTTNGVVSSPAVARGVVVFGSLDGKVYGVGA